MTKRRDYKNKIASSLKVNLWGRQKLKVKSLKQLNNVETRPSEYGRMLFAKQRLKGFYGNISEKQLYNYVHKNNKNFLSQLERRLDITIFRMKFAISIFQARQLINHKHILVNGKPLNIPSYLLSPGDVITIHPKAKPLIFNSILNRLFEKQIQENPWKMVAKKEVSNQKVSLKKNLMLNKTIQSLNIQNNFLKKSFYSIGFELKYFCQNSLIIKKLQNFSETSFKDFISYNNSLLLKKKSLINLLQELPLFLLPNHIEINFKNLIGVYLYVPSTSEISVTRKFDIDEIKNFYNR